jgi:hypothetical protein
MENLFDELNNYVIADIFQLLEQKYQPHLIGICQRFQYLKNYVYQIGATKKMINEDLQQYKNLRVLGCLCNTNFTDNGIKHLPLRILHCGYNTKFTDGGIKDLPLKELYCWYNENFTKLTLDTLRQKKCYVSH